LDFGLRLTIRQPLFILDFRFWILDCGGVTRRFFFFNPKSKI